MHELLLNSESDLNRIVRYVVSNRSIKKRELAGYISLFIVTAISPITYLKPAYADEPPYGIPNDETIKSMQVAAVWLPTTTLLYLACVDFIQARAQNTVAVALNDILEGLPPADIRRQDVSIGSLSLLSAIPLTTPLVKYPLVSTDNDNLNHGANGLLVTVILISNGVAHLRPLQIITYNPWYGAPLTLVRSLFNKFEQRKWSAQDKLQHQLRMRKIARHTQLKTYLINALITKKTELIDGCFTFEKRYGWMPGYHII